MRAMSAEVRLRFQVNSEDAGARVDAFLAARHADISRSRAARLIKEGHVTVDGRVPKPSTTLSPGQAIVVDIPVSAPCGAVPEDIPLEVLYEDQDLIVVNKPAGLVVHPAPGHGGGTLVNALLHHCHDLSGIGGQMRPGIVHRLDKDTSGALVAAKNDFSHQALSSQFKERIVKKTYLALVHGAVREQGGSILLAVGRHPKDRKKMHAASQGGGRQAETLWRVRERFADASLLEVNIKTGRTHQIRVHLATLGFPVVGDPVYGGRRRGHALPASIQGKVPLPGRQLLHDWKLCFSHPRTGRVLTFTSPVPQDLEQVLAALRATGSSGDNHAVLAIPKG